jgi:TonB family protein
MSSIDREDQFVSEDELKRVLERWSVPEPSKFLDKRVVNSYHEEFRGSDAHAGPVLLPLQRKNEVVAMKFCSNCREEYADKFSFCPVDGTPLNGFVPKSEDSTITAVQAEPAVVVPEMADSSQTVREPAIPAALAASIDTSEETISHGLAQRGEYHLTIMEDTGLARRLASELSGVAHQYELTWPEFKRDPIGFTKRSFVGYGQMAGRFFSNRNVLIAVGIAIVAMAVLIAGIVVLDRSNSAGASRTAVILFSVVAFGMLVATFATWFGKDQGAAVAGAQPSDSRNVAVALTVAFVFIFGIIGSYVLMELLAKRNADAIAQNSDELQVEQIFDIPQEQPTPDPGTAGLNKGDGGGSKPKPEKAGGGGGGGRQDPKPASFGKTPQASLEVPQVVAPDPNPPKIKNPSLPVAATVVADPLLVPPDARVLPYGDFKSTSTVASSGPGTGNGIGTGTGGGIGPGEGGGIGPGRGGNIGGGDRRDGGGGPGGGGGGDYNRIFSGRDVTSKARVLSKPEPQYTEDARKNQITGTVVLRAVFSSSGQVTQIRAVSGLPYGLTERAIAAARQIKFVPATKDGRQVSMWMQLEYNFNLY